MSLRPLHGGSSHILEVLLIMTPLVLIPYGYKAFTANLLAQFLIYGLLAMSLGLIWGYGGIMSFGQTAFFGIGGYAYGVVALNLIHTTGNTNLALLAGLAVSLLAAALVGYFMFYGRISDVYASIITLALTLVLYAFMLQTSGDEWVIGRARLGGFNGMFGQGKSMQDIANYQIPPVTIWLPGMGHEGYAFRINRQTASGYYLVVGVCAGVYLACQGLLRSRVGRVMVAIRENEVRAASLGYDTRFYKTLVFTIGGGIAGLAGVLFAAWGRFMNPDRLGLAFASSTVVFVILGGRTHLLGGFVGALLIGYLTNYLGEAIPFPAIPGDASVLTALAMEASNRMVKEAPLLAQGAILVLMVLLLRDGLVPPLVRWGKRHLWLCWLLLLPLVVAFYGLQVLCRQLEVCLF
jgi:branched-chain amino acid transport system permease protein